ncbi:MAG: CBS domain-containing protein [Methylococcales bacterium]|jgi:predicted transcriptional regulator|nr:CBS domain-containing protein [Methylococcaceae bacterium]
MSHSEKITVKDVMKTTFSTIDGDATVSAALLLMKSSKTSTIIVNRRHDHDEFGLITSSDIARQVMAKNRAPDRVNVYEIMETPVICVRPEMDIRLCARLFANYNLVRAPVIENDKIIGMISPNTLVLDGLYAIYS